MSIVLLSIDMQSGLPPPNFGGCSWQGLQEMQEEFRRRAIFEKQILDLAQQNLKVMRAFQRDFATLVLRYRPQ